MEHPDTHGDVVAVSIGGDDWLVWDDKQPQAWIVTDAVINVETAR